MPLKIAVIGGGAAGFFGAICAKENSPSAVVTLYEKQKNTLAKVRVSGGGRCNVTHQCFDIGELIKFYPRGSQFLRKLFYQFQPADTVEWYKNRGVALKAESDGRMFPVTDSSETIIEALTGAANSAGVIIKTKSGIKEIRPAEYGYTLIFEDGNRKDVDRVLITIGGAAKKSALDLLNKFDFKIVSPAPSLFTFNVKPHRLKSLMGVAVPVGVKIAGSKLQSEGPVLITHWGFSGPAVLKLSAFGAKVLAEKNYQFPVLINWANKPEDEVRNIIANVIKQSPKKQVRLGKQFGLPGRLWQKLVETAEIQDEERWGNLSKKKINKLLAVLVTDRHEVNGKTTFKEEFVTAGGISLSEINHKTMEAKRFPGLYFAGEVLDIDGVTGGFNFQAAWTTSFIAGGTIGKI